MAETGGGDAGASAGDSKEDTFSRVEGATNHYETLGVSKDASQEEINSAYKNTSRQVHPDKNDNSDRANECSKKVNSAKEALSDPATRAAYDQSQAQAQSQNQNQNQSQGQNQSQSQSQSQTQGQGQSKSEKSDEADENDNQKTSGKGMGDQSSKKESKKENETYADEMNELVEILTEAVSDMTACADTQTSAQDNTAGKDKDMDEYDAKAKENNKSSAPSQEQTETLEEGIKLMM